MTCRRVSWPRSVRTSSSQTTSSGDSTFGSIKAGGGVSVARTACTSASPKAVLRQLMRTMRSTPSSVWGFAKSAKPAFRAASLSFGAMPSSSSTQTISVPHASALGNIAGCRPGEKIKLRRGRTMRVVASFIGCPSVVFSKFGGRHANNHVMSLPQRRRALGQSQEP